ncbi:MAG: HAD-IA family hydrolase [Opitutus sp.]
MSKAIRTVVFDLDGTLVDSMPFVLEAFAHAIIPFAPALSPDEWRTRMGGPPERILEGLLPKPEHAAAALHRLNAYTEGRWDRVAAFDGMTTLIDDFVRSGISLGLWTGRERASALSILGAQRLRGKLTTCICGDDLPSHKPDPAGLAVALREMATAADEAIFVGDAEVDVLAGAALGVKTLLITHGLTVDTRILAMAWRTVESPVDAYNLLRGELLAGKSK